VNPLSNQPANPNNVQPEDTGAHNSNSGTDLLQAEIEHNIPVKHQSQEHSQSGDGTNNQHGTIAHLKQFLEMDVEKNNESGADSILTEVNHSIKNEEKAQNGKHGVIKNDLHPAKARNAKPFLVVIIALIVACALGVAAFYAFSQSNRPIPATATKQSTQKNVAASNNSSQSNNGAVASAAEQDNLSGTIQTTVNDLNDEQDFNQTDLSDQNLGL
jgi:hypothetical protein